MPWRCEARNELYGFHTKQWSLKEGIDVCKPYKAGVLGNATDLNELRT